MIIKFGYKSAPDGIKLPIFQKEQDNVIGVELEYDNTTEKDCENCEGDCDFCEDEGLRHTKPEIKNALHRLIDKGVIINPENVTLYRHKDHNAVLERDGSVDGEIILQADYQRNIMKKVNKIHKELNSSILNNSRHTSCHIHRNVNYLNQKDISKYDYQKSNEFLAGIFYRISGRDKDSYQRWCTSIFNDININYVSMMTMAKNVDRMDHLINGKYFICNCDHRNTVETRIFSNYYNFDPKFIKLYIDFTTLAIDIAEEMRQKSYVQEFDMLIDWINDFCNKTHRRKKLLKPFALNQYVVKKEDIKYVELNGQWSEIYDRIESLSRQSYLSYSNQIIGIIRILRDFDLELNTSITMNQQVNFDNILKEINNRYLEDLEQL